MPIRREIFALTGLRFVAALYVFLFHIHIRWPLTMSRPISNFLSQGAVGMSVFFILSGFVLTLANSDKSLNLERYFRSRFARIYPVYATAALLATPWLAKDIWQSDSLHSFMQQLTKLACLILTDLTLTQAWFPQQFIYWNNGASWSISDEMFFYVLFPFLFIVISRLSLSRLSMTSIVIYIFSIIPSLTYFAFDIKPIPDIFSSVPIYRLPEFIAGICAGVAVTHHGVKFPVPGVFAGVCLLIFSGVTILIGNGFPTYTSYNFIAVPLICVLIISLYQGGGSIGAILGCRLMIWLGHTSYCFYSFQVILLLLLIPNHDMIVNKIPLLSNNIILASAAFLILQLVAGLGYQFIEKPTRSWLLNRRSASPVTAGRKTVSIATGP